MSIFSVSIELYSRTLSLAELTSLAGAEPTRSHVKGRRRSKSVPASKVHARTMWSMDSSVELDSWTLKPQWPYIAPVLASLADAERGGDVEAILSIGTSARGLGFAFDLHPEQVALLARAQCGIWIDSYQGNWDRDDLPADYPYPEEGTLLPPHRWRRARTRVYAGFRAWNSLGKVGRRARKIRRDTGQ